MGMKESENKGFIYWKIEQSATPWNIIPNTDQARQEAIKRGAMFFTWACLSSPYTGNGDPEPHRWGDLPLDFDSTNIKTALDQLKLLTLSFLPSVYDIDPHEMQFYVSGGKGFHAVIPSRLLNSSDGDPLLPLIYKKMASGWKDKLKLSTLDMSLYNMKRGKMFRIPNVRRQNGKYKVPLLLEEVMVMDAARLIELSKKKETWRTYKWKY